MPGHYDTMTSNVKPMQLAKLGWLPRQANLLLHGGLHLKSRGSQTQTWIALGKLVATYNFAASLFCTVQSLVAGWPGLDKGTLFLVLHLWNSHTGHTHHSLSLQEISSFLRTDKIGYFRASNSRRHALGMLSWAGSSQRPCERRTYNQ